MATALQPMKRLFLRWLGVDSYVRWVQPVSALYHSLFRSGDMQEQGLRLACELLSEGDTVFDVGAHIGKFTSIAARRVGRTGRVVSFEPVGWSRAVLSRMVRLRGFRQVRIVAAGVSDHSGAAVMSVPLRADGRPDFMLSYLATAPNEWGEVKEGGEIKKEGGEVTQEPVDLVTLDDYCQRHSIARVDFIKCDTEGHEAEVFRGARRTLEGAHPTIYCEIDANLEARSGRTPNALFADLRQRGYQAYLADGSGQALVPVEGYECDSDYCFIHASRWPAAAKRIRISTGRRPSLA